MKVAGTVKGNLKESINHKRKFLEILAIFMSWVIPNRGSSCRTALDLASCNEKASTPVWALRTLLLTLQTTGYNWC